MTTTTARVVHKIVNNADTVIILKNSLVHFAVWDELDANGPNDEELAFDSEPAIDEPDVEEPVEEPDVEEPVEEPDVEEPVEEPDVEEPTVAEPVIESRTSDISTQEDEIHYHVSSSHLRAASPKFESMLSGGAWKEGIPDEKDGRYYILAEDWDEDAFLILLNVFHLRNRHVPRSVPLEMLAKIATLVDYYDCGEAAELFTEMWIKHLKDTTPVPLEHCRDLMLWMCIAWVLRLPHEFAQTTHIAIKQSRQGELSTLNLPITGFVNSIDQARIEAIGIIISQLHDLRDEYRSAYYGCPNSSYSFECGSILYGALTKEMESLDLLVPYPEAPFSRTSVSGLYIKVQNIKSPKWNIYGRRGQHSCDLNEKVKDIANSVMDRVNGLDLKDFAGALIC